MPAGPRSSPQTSEIDIEDLIKDEEMVITISHAGYIKRNPLTTYRAQKRGGKGKIGMETKEEDFVERLFTATAHSYILFFTNKGRVYWLKVHQIPEASRQAKGKAIVNLIQISQDERVTAALPVREFTPDHFILMATKKGIIKKTELESYSHPRPSGIIAITLEEGDELISAEVTDGKRDVFLGTRDGLSIRFSETDVREIGRTGKGVIGIRLDEGNEVVGMEIVRDDSTILTVTENGYGKRSTLEDYRSQGRGGKGIITIKITEKNGTGDRHGPGVRGRRDHPHHLERQGAAHPGQGYFRPGQEYAGRTSLRYRRGRQGGQFRQGGGARGRKRHRSGKERPGTSCRARIPAVS